MIKIIDKSKCCGCSACYAICPKKCIEMKKDVEGFVYPLINKMTCIECNLCEKVCPIINKTKNTQYLRKAYAVKNINKTERKNSSSGGMFISLAKYIIKNKGIVYGVGFDEVKNVVHKRVSKIEDLSDLQGSKYIQSHIGDVYKKIKKDLENDLLVLFVGTPCQINGLRNYICRDYKNLILIDFICHGVSSPLVWREYCNGLEKIFRSKIDSISFRNKDINWENYSLKVIFKNNDIYTNKANDDLFMKGFLKNLYLRLSCYNCNFKQIDRVSDITLGDFWGVKNILLKFYDELGVSLIIIHSNKGKAIVDAIKNELIFDKINLLQSIKYNLSAIESAKANKNRKKFFDDFYEDKLNLNDLIVKYTKERISIGKKIKLKIKNLLKGGF